MQVKELGHIVLYVRDVQRSAHFYGEILGWRSLTPSGSDGTRIPLPIAMFSAPSNRTHHELLLIEVGQDAAPQPAGARVGLYHFGLKIGDTDDELRAARDRLQAAGVSILGSSDHGVTHSLYIADPDGNEVELFIDVPGVDWRNDPSLLMTAAKPLRL